MRYSENVQKEMKQLHQKNEVWDNFHCIDLPKQYAPLTGTVTRLKNNPYLIGGLEAIRAPYGDCNDNLPVRISNPIEAIRAPYGDCNKRPLYFSYNFCEAIRAPYGDCNWSSIDTEIEVFRKQYAPIAGSV